MAILANRSNDREVYLNKYHLFGRKEQSVDTYIDDASISRVHAKIEWADESWFLEDKSKNGIWLNNEKLEKNKKYVLRQGDKITFSLNENIEFEVQNLDAPQDVIIAKSPEECIKQGLPSFIILQHINLLPTEDNPEIVLHFASLFEGWNCETLDNATEERQIADGDTLHFSGLDWQLVRNSDRNKAETVIISPEQQQLNPEYVFRLSQDEELAELKVKHAGTVMDLDIRSHHYLTASLARYKKHDMDNHLDHSLQGWIPIRRLSKDLGLSENHINIQIHRARKQLIEQFSQANLIPPNFIERRRGYARFASDNFRIFKGEQLEI